MPQYVQCRCAEYIFSIKKEVTLKILIIRLSSIGDIVLTTPVIRCVKEQAADAELHFLTKSSFAGVLKNNPYVDKLHLHDGDLSKTVSMLEEENFNYIIDLHHNLRSLKLKLRLAVKSSSFNKLNIQKWLLVNFKVNTLPDLHIVDRYLKTAEKLGVQNDGKGLDYFLEKEYDLSQMLPPSHQNYVGFVIGGAHATKRLPQEKIVEACQLIRKPVVLLGGKEDKQGGEQIADQAGDHVFNACGSFNLDESAYLVKMAEKIITHDTGLMHIAAAFNKPIISVWGNTVPEFGMYPYKVEWHRCMEVKGLGCRPCSKIGYPKCPLKHFRCMNEINTERIAELANS